MPTAHTSDAAVPATPLRTCVVPLATVVQTGPDGPVVESPPPHEARIKGARATCVARAIVRSLIIFSRLGLVFLILQRCAAFSDPRNHAVSPPPPASRYSASSCGLCSA